MRNAGQPWCLSYGNVSWPLVGIRHFDFRGRGRRTGPIRLRRTSGIAFSARRHNTRVHHEAGPDGIADRRGNIRAALRIYREAGRGIAIRAAYVPGTNYVGPTALSGDAQGNLVLVGSSGTATPGAYVSPLSWSACNNVPIAPSYPASIYISKFNSANFQALYTAQLTAPCGVEVGAVAVDNSGAIVLGLSTGPGLPLRDPLFAGPVKWP
jgi:hypothetical protein